jgi:hypothetical protein
LGRELNFGDIEHANASWNGERRFLSPVRHTVDFRAMQKVQRNSAISDVFEVQGLRRNRRKGRMPKFSFSHARKFQFPGRVPGPFAGAGLAGVILARCGAPGWWRQPGQHWLGPC